MAEFMTGMKRTDYCGDLRIGDVGRGNCLRLGTALP